MRRIIYLSLLLLIPFLASAEYDRENLNGKWINPYHGKVIKIKANRNGVRVKNLSRRGWTTFRPSRRGKFIDKRGNSIRINAAHELLYRSNCGNERIRFVKKGSINRNRNSGYYSYTNGYDDYSNYGSYNNSYYGRNDRHSDINNIRSNRDLRGKYFVRENNEYIIIEDTRNGLRAKRGNRDWINYRQNKYRKNEYLDDKGNKYQVRSDRSLTWRNKSGSTSLNLSK